MQEFGGQNLGHNPSLSCRLLVMHPLFGLLCQEPRKPAMHTSQNTRNCTCNILSRPHPRVRARMRTRTFMHTHTSMHMQTEVMATFAPSRLEACATAAFAILEVLKRENTGSAVAVAST